ncbi:MAG: cysteine--tRNA ligase [Actinomycetota bacterium]|nr:cysteine--tRNA ligase [Actinomycetota bacterium]MDA3013252.1 cysteine--tRNA ligase [Actinomycetota bacterium]
MLKVYNSLINRIQETSFEKDEIKIYLCGPTVQSSPHIGHGRSAVVFDFFVRYLKHLKYKVIFVRNITDIDDKIIEKSKAEGISPKELSEKVIFDFHKAYSELNCLNPEFEPRATESIEQIISFIELLIEKGYAYISNSGVYFEVAKYSDYFALSGRKTDEVLSGTRIDVKEDKKKPEDFALWKFAKDGEPFWNTPWGKGRPGWHIECSAMIRDIFASGIDFHCGGNDLIFPHHENELAQSSSAYEDEVFVKYWMHNGMVNLSGQKMSKSEGNIKLLNQYIDDYGGELIRFFYLRSHYRKPQEFSEDLLIEAKTTLIRLQELLQEVDPVNSNEDTMRIFYDCMNDDLNTPKLLGEIFTTINKLGEKSKNDQKNIKQTIKFIFKLLGFELNFTLKIDQDKLIEFFKKYQIDFENLNLAMEKFIHLRETYRKDKNFKAADTMREDIYNLGINILDGETIEWYWRSS